MIFQAGVENNLEGRSIAWALEHPGCFAYGINAEKALLNLENALERYAGWILRHDTNTWLTFAAGDVELVINGVWDVYNINDEMDKVSESEGDSINSFFPYDWKPLTGLEIKHAMSMLAWSRSDLLKTLQGLSPEKRTALYAGERWSIDGILGHVGGAEWWYLERLGLAFPKIEIPEEPLVRLEKVRKHFLAILPRLANAKRVIGVDGELWSPRKLVRRALWHELDHVEHIRKLL